MEGPHWEGTMDYDCRFIVKDIPDAVASGEYINNRFPFDQRQVYTKGKHIFGLLKDNL